VQSLGKLCLCSDVARVKSAVLRHSKLSTDQGSIRRPWGTQGGHSDPRGQSPRCMLQKTTTWHESVQKFVWMPQQERTPQLSHSGEHCKSMFTNGLWHNGQLFVWSLSGPKEFKLKWQGRCANKRPLVFEPIFCVDSR